MIPAIMNGQRECQALMEMAFAFCQSQCLFTAVELGLFSLLEEQALNQSEITSRLGVNERGALDFLDSLVALRLLNRARDGYSNTPAASLYLTKQSPFYIGDLLRFIAGRLYPVWGHLPEAIRTGLPQNEARTVEDYYANLGADKIRLECFLKGMTGLSVRPAEVIAQRFPWRQYNSFIDLGGGSGSLAVHLLRSHPQLSGGVFELPSTRPFFEAFASGLQERLKFYDGDFFRDPIPASDVFILGHILHNWNMDEKKELLSRVYDAVNPGGSVIVYEWLLDESRDKTLPLMDSLNMLLVTRTGSGISEGTCQDLLRNAGFRNCEIFASDEPYTLVVGWKG